MVADTAPGLVTVASGVPRPRQHPSSATELQRSRVVLYLCAGAALVLGTGELLAGHPSIAFTNLAEVIAQAGLLLVLSRRPERAQAITHLCLALALLGTSLGVFLAGGAQSTPVWFFAGIPLLAGATLGGASALGWALAALLAIFAMEAGIFLMMGPRAEARLEWIATASFLVVASTATTLALRRLNVWHIASLEQRENTIRTLLQGLAEKNREVSIARDEAISASRAKSEFLAVMSHEIRTPLNAVIGLTGVLLDTPLSGDQMDIAGTIRSSGSALLTLLNDILDFSKIEAGRLDLESAPFDVVECAEDALELMGSAAAERKLDLSCHAATDLPAQVNGDAARVRQILVNLVSNAVKFTSMGAVEVHLGVEALRPGETILVHGSVRDTGPGIPRDRWPALFEPFSQLDASTTRKFGGTGLGLAICRKLAERMGGRVWIESSVGVGSTFHFTFEARVIGQEPATPVLRRGSALVITPRDGTRRAVCAQLAALGVAAQAFAEPPDAAGGPPLSPDILIVDYSVSPADLGPVLAAGAAPAWIVLGAPRGSLRDTLRRLRGERSLTLPVPVRRSQLAAALRRTLEGGSDTREPTVSRPTPEPHRLRVLLAEDNPVNQRVATLLLERLGHRVDVVGDGKEAITEVCRGEYDLVLMDMRMPEMDGLTATRQIRAALPPEKQPYIIALTANVAEADRDECIAAGMNAFLSKPIVIADLQHTLRMVIRSLDPEHRSPEAPAVDTAGEAPLADLGGAGGQPAVRV